MTPATHFLPNLALLLVSSLLLTLPDSTHAHALPRQTITLPHHVLDVVPWPPQPTPAPIVDLLLHRRQFNTVCGYIGGDLNLPATCSAGSHCVVDPVVRAIGCCPDGAAACTTGVFTGCVDFNSGPQTELNPYVYTCGGSDVCYRNVFDGGFFQYGCGSASNLATTVAATASGLTSAIKLTSVSAELTATPTTLSEPTTIDTSTGTRSLPPSSASTRSASSATGSSTRSGSSVTTRTSSRSASASNPTTTRSGTPTTTNTRSTSTPTTTNTRSSSARTTTNTRSSSTVTSNTRSSTTSTTSTTSSTTTSSTTSSTSSSTTSTTTSTSSSTRTSTTSTPSATTDPATSAPELTQGGVDRTGAIIGGTISGVAVFIALIAVAIYFIRRKRGNVRHGPGPLETQYISPAAGGAGFSPLPGGQGGWEAGRTYAAPLSSGGSGTPYIRGGGGSSVYSSDLGSYRPVPGFNPNSTAPSAPGYGWGPSGGVVAVGASPNLSRGSHMEGDQVPLTLGQPHEIDDFTRGFNDALTRIDEEDDDIRPPANTNSMAASSRAYGSPREGGDPGDYNPAKADPNGYTSDGDEPERPLWQENRRQSRNLMWM